MKWGFQARLCLDCKGGGDGAWASCLIMIDDRFPFFPFVSRWARFGRVVWTFVPLRRQDLEWGS